LLITDTGVPDRFIKLDPWGGGTMLRLDDGWCAALDRDTMLCTIYDQRPLICREFATGSAECMDERTSKPGAGVKMVDTSEFGALVVNELKAMPIVK
jgi:Fe-S-cluster containining protein